MAKRKRKVLRPTGLRMTRLTFEAWMKCYPDSNKEEWEMVTQPHCLSDFVMDGIEQMGYNPDLCVDDVEKVKIVPIDDEYFKWLEETGTENTTERRAEYDMPDDKAEELLKKYHLNRDNHLMAFVSAVFSENEYKMSLSDETQSVIRNCLNRVYGAENVWFPGYIMDIDNFEEKFDKLMDMGSEYFESRRVIRLDSCKDGMMEEKDLTFVIIPFMVKGTCSASVVDINKFFDSDIMRDFPEEHTFDFLGSGINEMLAKDLCVDGVNTMPNAINYNELEDFIDEIENSFVTY